MRRCAPVSANGGKWAALEPRHPHTRHVELCDFLAEGTVRSGSNRALIVTWQESIAPLMLRIHSAIATTSCQGDTGLESKRDRPTYRNMSGGWWWGVCVVAHAMRPLGRCRQPLEGPGTELMIIFVFDMRVVEPPLRPLTFDPHHVSPHRDWSRDHAAAIVTARRRRCHEQQPCFCFVHLCVCVLRLVSTARSH